MREYPWHALESITRRDARLASRVRRGLRLGSGAEISGALAEILGVEVGIVVRGVGGGRAPEGSREIVVRAGETAHYGLSVEPDGVQAVLSRVLGRPLGLSRQELELGSALTGAAAAVLLQVARRVASEPVVLASAPEREALALQLTLLIDHQAFAATLRAWVELPPSEVKPERERLRLLDVELPLVVGLSLASRGDLQALGVGDAWFPGAGWWIDRALTGRGALAGARSELGVWVDLAPDGTVVLRGGSAELRADAELASAQSPMPGPAPAPEASLESLVAEAPVVVRVELGTVSVNAGDVAALRPGDVLETGQRLGQPVVLRVAGRAIARGDLVEVEGELGVRIRELLGSEP